jgi:signal peptidase II
MTRTRNCATAAQKQSGLLMLKKYLSIVLIIAAVIVLDQASKLWIEDALPRHQQIEIIPQCLDIVHVRNPGVAFGLLQNIPDSYRATLLVATTALALVLLIVLLVQTNPSQRLERWSLALIMGGAVGNLIDRVRLGEVIDFIDVHWANLYHWPAFNVADSCISTGITCMVLLELKRIFSSRARKKTAGKH